LNIAHSITALFILWGKNHVWFLPDASAKRVFDSSDRGIYDIKAMIELNMIIDQKI
tara:strand:+ start:496 stop:663 length:168 start_codon:yes stop_codon:yes gene_type:complete